MPRTEEFPPNGRRILTTPAAIVTAWRGYTRRIPAQYALGTAQHETNLTLNEVDTEENGFKTYGIYQLSAEEADRHGVAMTDLLTLDGATRLLAILAEHRLAAICTAAGMDLDAHHADLWAYLALSHNQGLGAAQKTIHAHGLDWAGYKRRNPTLDNMARYGDDCISGGEHWTAELG